MERSICQILKEQSEIKESVNALLEIQKRIDGELKKIYEQSKKDEDSNFLNVNKFFYFTNIYFVLIDYLF
jgi:hypothetical protein